MEDATVLLEVALTGSVLVADPASAKNKNKTYETLWHDVSRTLFCCYNRSCSGHYRLRPWLGFSDVFWTCPVMERGTCTNDKRTVDVTRAASRYSVFLGSDNRRSRTNWASAILSQDRPNRTALVHLSCSKGLERWSISGGCDCESRIKLQVDYQSLTSYQ